MRTVVWTDIAAHDDTVASPKSSCVTVPSSLILEALHHAELQIQLDAFSFVCVDLKTTAEVTRMEMSMLQSFLPRNLNICTSGARHQYLSNLTSVLSRLRDSWVAFRKSSDAVCRKLAKYDAEYGSNDVSEARTAIVEGWVH